VTIPVDVSLQTVQAELVAVAEYAAAAALEVNTDSLRGENLVFSLCFANRDGEHFYAEFQCAEYPLYPPTVEFVNHARSERGTRRLYPQGFHNTPCVCMRYNRKAYSDRGGPHGEWRLLDWRLPTGNGIAINTLALMVSDLHSKIRQSSGRLG